MNILILGDVGASASNLELFKKADKDLFSSEIQDICRQSDIVLLNLEKPLTDALTPLDKCPPDYAAPTETINGIKLLNPTAVTLANNHILDQQWQGIVSTVDILEKNGIRHVGTGKNDTEAREPLILEKNEYKIGIYACCEKEFSFAATNSGGANAYDPLITFDDIASLRGKCDYLIVLFHGGMQGYPYPTPQQQRICRKMCEKGADLVVCQHSHIIGCEEDHEGSKIIYGQGNFLLDDLNNENWQSGLMIRVLIEEGKPAIEVIPIRTEKHRAVLDRNPEQVKKCYAERSKRILDHNTVENLFTELCGDKLSDYLLKLSGKSTLVQRIMGRLGLVRGYKSRYSEEACNRILDYLYCDTHKEAIEKGLEDFLKNRKK